MLNYKKQVGNMPADIHNNKGIDYCVNQDFDAGIAEFNKALQANPNFPLAYFNRSIAYDNLGMSICHRNDLDKWHRLMRDFNDHWQACHDDPKLLQFIRSHYGITKD